MVEKIPAQQAKVILDKDKVTSTSNPFEGTSKPASAEQMFDFYKTGNSASETKSMYAGKSSLLTGDLSTQLNGSDITTGKEVSASSSGANDPFYIAKSVLANPNATAEEVNAALSATQGIKTTTSAPAQDAGKQAEQAQAGAQQAQQKADGTQEKEKTTKEESTQSEKKAMETNQLASQAQKNYEGTANKLAKIGESVNKAETARDNATSTAIEASKSFEGAKTELNQAKQQNSNGENQQSVNEAEAKVKQLEEELNKAEKHEAQAAQHLANTVAEQTQLQAQTSKAENKVKEAKLAAQMAQLANQTADEKAEDAKQDNAQAQPAATKAENNKNTAKQNQTQVNNTLEMQKNKYISLLEKKAKDIKENSSTIASNSFTDNNNTNITTPKGIEKATGAAASTLGQTHQTMFEENAKPVGKFLEFEF